MGNDYGHPDGHHDELYQARLQIYGQGGFYIGPVETPCFGREGSARSVGLLVHRANGETPDGNDFIKNYVCRFSDPNQEEPDYECWTPLGAGISTHPFLTLEEGECLWTNDDVLVPNYIEKFHHWNQDPNEYIFTNYQDFSILPTTDHLHSFLRDIHSATIRTDLISGGTGGTIKFKDPWLPDGAEKLEIHKNRGMDGAEWYPHNTSLVIQPNESDFYRGVFKDQGLPNWTPPYYRVRVEDPQPIDFHGQSTTWYFQGWQGSNVQFQYSNQLETGVAFTDDDAVAKAVFKGHPVSNTTSATSTNSQRKMVYQNGIYHNGL